MRKINIFLILFVLITCAAFSDPATLNGPYDSCTGAMVQIGFDNHKLIKGDKFRFRTQVNLTNAASITFALKTPAAPMEIHFSTSIDSQYESHLELYECAVHSTGGVEVNPLNSNRNNSSTNIASMAHSVQYDLTGAVTLEDFVAGEGKKVGSISEGAYERILKYDTTYIARITNNVASTNRITVEVSWHEHEPVEQ